MSVRHDKYQAEKGESMDRRRANRRHLAARRRAHGRGRYAAARRSEGAEGLSRFFCIFSVLLLAAGLRLTGGSRLEILREGMNDVLSGGGSVKDAVAVLGHALIGESQGKDESAVVTFGKKLLGLETEEKQPAPHEPSRSAREAKEPESNRYDETAPGQDGQPTASGYAAGLAPDRLVLPAIAESPMPEAITARNLRFELPGEELDDDTPNVSFKIPSPDRVDDEKYKLGFDCRRPLSGGRVTSPFGYRIHPIHGNTTFHYGVDLGAAKGTRVSSFARGTVAEAGYSAVYGNYLLLSHPDGFATFYGHLSKVYVKKGSRVDMGEKIAAVGSTGWSTGPHLHFEIRRNGRVLNPFDYLSFS